MECIPVKQFSTRTTQRGDEQWDDAIFKTEHEPVHCLGGLCLAHTGGLLGAVRCYMNCVVVLAAAALAAAALAGAGRARRLEASAPEAGRRRREPLARLRTHRLELELVRPACRLLRADAEEEVGARRERKAARVERERVEADVGRLRRRHAERVHHPHLWRGLWGGRGTARGANAQPHTFALSPTGMLSKKRPSHVAPVTFQ